MGWKIGYGVTEQLLLSLSLYGSFHENAPSPGIGGLGITVFHKKTAPSLFFSVVLPIFLYDPYGAPASVGPGASVGVGYEFINNWTVEADFSFGTQSINQSGFSDGYLFGDSTSTTFRGKTEGYALGFKINYRFAMSHLNVLNKMNYERPSIDYIWY